MTGKVEKILFISLSCVGDAVMTTPVIQALHALYPEARMDVVADKRSSLLFTKCSYIDKVVHKEKKKLFRGSLALLGELWKTRYDLIVDVRTDGLVYLLRGKKRFTKWHAHAYGEHAVERMMGVIHGLYGDKPIPPTQVWFGEEHDAFARETLSVLPGGAWLAFAPAVALEAKLWPAEKYAALADSLKDIITGVVLLGGPGEEPFARAVIEKLSLPYVDTVGSADLLQAAAILKRAKMFVGSDSGLGHVAGGVGTPTLTFFSNDIPERCHPWGNKAVWLKGGNGIASEISVVDAEAKIRECLS